MYDLNKEEGSYYITMEYVSGEDLKSFIRRVGQLPSGKAISIAKQVAEGLVEAHRLGVIHRDLKPSNIMIDKDGNARIMDFGIARSLKGKGITGAGVIIGTPEYMSPEQVEGKDIDHRSDVYSLGVILYEMVTGQLPFEGDTPLAVALKHKNDKPKDPNEYNTQIPDDLNRLIMKCLEKNKETRYQNAYELISVLDQIQKGIPTPAKEAPAKKPLTSKEIKVSFNIKKLFIPSLLLIAIIIVGLFLWRPWIEVDIVSTQSGGLSLAVLPFEDLSPQKDQEYLCDGLAEELINRLSVIENLWIPARTSLFAFKGKGLSIQELGNELKVGNILEGSLRKSENRLRITIRVISISDNRTLWQKVYNRDEGDIFDLQDEISLAVLDSLKIELLTEEKEKLIKRHTDNIEAYNLYLKGRHYWDIFTVASFYQALECFRQAVQLDPGYAPAYAGLADSFIQLAYQGEMLPKDAYSMAKKHVKKALELDSTNAESHVTLATIKLYYDWDWAGSENGFKHAISLNPGYAPAHYLYAELLVSLGRFDEAITEAKKAVELDPLSQSANEWLSFVLYTAREYDSAKENIQNTLQLYPSSHSAFLYLGLIYLNEGRNEKAISILNKMVEIENQWSGRLCYGYAVSGNEIEARNYLEDMQKISEENHFDPIQFTFAYIGLGEFEKAIEFLEKAYEERSGYLTLLKVDPEFDSLRSYPRFKTLVTRMNLDQSEIK
jgi:serine/threonine protein kinase/Tfp pilus assembly protein PilF